MKDEPKKECVALEKVLTISLRIKFRGENPCRLIMPN